MYLSAGEGIHGHCNYSKRENYSSNIFYLVVKCRRSLYAVYFLGFQGRELYQSSLRTFDDLHLFKYGACSSLDHANHIREKPEYQMASMSQNCNNFVLRIVPQNTACSSKQSLVHKDCWGATGTHFAADPAKHTFTQTPIEANVCFTF